MLNPPKTVFIDLIQSITKAWRTSGWLVRGPKADAWCLMRVVTGVSSPLGLRRPTAIARGAAGLQYGLHDAC